MSASPTDAPAPRLSLQIQTREDVTIVHCRGKLTFGVTSLLHDEVKRLIPHAKRIDLDLTDLVQMDSMGLGTVVSLYVSAKAAGCDLRLINLSKQVRQLLSVANLLSFFEVYGEHIVKIP